MRIHKIINNKMESRRYLATLIVVSMLVIISVTSYENAYSVNSDGEEVVPPAVLEAYGYLPIRTPQELAKIGNDPAYPLNGKYYLSNDIVFTSSDDLNGGMDIGISATVTGNSLTVKLTPSSGSVTSFNAWLGTSSAQSTSSTVTLSGIPPGTYILTVGGTAGGNRFAYSVQIDTTTSGEKTQGVTFNSNGNFSSIGSSSNPFTGIFDGNGYGIKGIIISSSSSTAVAYAGLFGYVSGAMICNLGLVDSTVVASSFDAGAYAGGIAGYYYSTAVIKNCYNTGSVTAMSSSSSAYAGGIAGYCDNLEVIENCYNTGDVSASATSSSSPYSAYAYAGGITGDCNCHYNYSTLIIKNCYNTGSVTASATSSSSSSANAYAGGIMGDNHYNYSTLIIKNCYNTGSVTAMTSSSSAYAGGIAGYYHSTAVIENCYNTGSVTATSSSSGAYASAFAGGIAGHYYSTAVIENCYNTGSVTAMSSSSSAYAGGIAGYCDSAVIENCYNTGDVSASTSDYSAGAGGIAGILLAAAIENCYNTGSVTAMSSSSGAGAGGIAGILLAAAIENCYFLEGKVSHNAIFEDMIWGADLSSILRDGGTGDQVSGAKTKEQMTPTLEEARNGDSIYFIGTGGWNFGEYGVWTIVEGVNDGYPILKSLRQVIPGTPSYKVILTPGAGYTLTPEDGSSSPVDSGGSFSFTVSADSGYVLNYVMKVTVNGVPWTLAEGTYADGVGVYTLTNITEDKTVAVVFSPIIESSYDYNGGTSVEIDGTVDPSAGATYVKVYITFSDGSVISSSFSFGPTGEFSFGYSGSMRPISYLVTAYDGKPGMSGSNMVAWTMTNGI